VVIEWGYIPLTLIKKDLVPDEALKIKRPYGEHECTLFFNRIEKSCITFTNWAPKMTSLGYWIKKAYHIIDDWYELWIYNFIHYKRICRLLAPAIADCRAGRMYDMDGNKIGEWKDD